MSRDISERKTDRLIEQHDKLFKKLSTPKNKGDLLTLLELERELTLRETN